VQGVVKGSIGLLILVFLLTSCGGSEPQDLQIVKRPPPKTEVPLRGAMEEGEGIVVKQSTFMLPKRNPFKTYISPKSKDVFVPKTPLQRYELTQLKLVAIIWGIESPVGMVEAPDGKGYTIKRGDLVGNASGTVSDITEDSVVIEERSKSYITGGPRVKSFTLNLPLPKE